MTLNVETGDDEPANSVLLVLPSGAGKTTLLCRILQRSNPKFFPVLPEKIFESEILKMPNQAFDNKVFVEDDLITTFRGTSSKQRDQLMGFFNTFLTKGEYGRAGSRKKGRIVCIFGIAEEHYSRNKKRMLQSTFSDRFIIVRLSLDDQDKKRILNSRLDNSTKRKLPKVKLPLKRTPTDVKVSSCFSGEINELAMMMDKRGVMTYARAQTHVLNFIKANALLNGRDTVVEDDLRVLKTVFPLYLGANSGSVDIKVREFILESTANGIPVNGRQIKDLVITETGCEERAVQSVLSNLRNQKVVNFSKVGRGRGYDFEYWL